MKTQLKTRQLTCLAYLKINKNKQLTRRALFIQELQFANFHKFHNYESKVLYAVRAHSGALHVPRDNFKWMLKIVCTTNVQLFKWVEG